MDHPQLQNLLGAVRRRLWGGQFVAAARLALWGSSGLMLLAVAAHLGLYRAPAGLLLVALGALWAALLLRAAWRRPTDAACALWADRHLAGASAYSTLHCPPGRADAQALRSLQAWAVAQVPHSLQRLRARHEPARLARPLLSAGVCAALAALVNALVDFAPALPQPAAAASAAVTAARATPLAQTTEAAALVSEIGRALRSTDPPAVPEAGAGARGPAAGSARNDESAATASDGAPPAGAQAAGSPTSAGAPLAAAPPSGAAQSGGASAGREAGDSRDERADVGVSRPLQGTMTVQRSGAGARRAPPALQADTERPATYDEEPGTRGAMAGQSDAAVAAATPPVAAESSRLSPTEASYVQAWMKASARRR